MNRITKEILATPSGGTIPLSAGPLPSTGYFVGGVVSALIIEPENDTPEEQVEALDHFVEYVSGPRVAADYLGWWTDEETGKLWVDATSWHPTEYEAGLFGRGRREIAIYDIAKERELRLVYADSV